MYKIVFTNKMKKDVKRINNLANYRECHIEPDWLLVYKYIDELLVLAATTTGTHSDIFGI